MSSRVSDMIANPECPVCHCVPEVWKHRSITSFNCDCRHLFQVRLKVSREEAWVVECVKRKVDLDQRAIH